MVTIKFPNGEIWSVSNWIFGRFYADIIACTSLDADLKHELDMAKLYQDLDLFKMPTERRDQAILVLKAVACRMLTIEAKELRGKDESAALLYEKALSEFLELAR